MNSIEVNGTHYAIVDRPEWTPGTLGICTDMYQRMLIEEPERALTWLKPGTEMVLGYTDEHSALFYDPSFAPTAFMKLLYPLMDPLRAELTVDDVRDLDGFTQQRIVRSMREAIPLLSPYGVQFCMQRLEEFTATGLAE